MAAGIVYQTRKVRINMTPLVDVVFILLVFFMLTSSFIQRRALPMNMPQLLPGVAVFEAEQMQRLDILPRAVLWQGRRLTLEALMREIRAGQVRALAVSARPDTELGRYIRAIEELGGIAGLKIHMLAPRED